MLPQRFSMMSDNFESKLNNKSTPKKFQTHSELNDKRTSVDAMYAEFLSLKDETNSTLIKSNNKTEKIESDVNQIWNDFNNLSKHNETTDSSIASIDLRLSKLEIMMERYSDLRNNYEHLKQKVNDLSNEVSVLKNINTESNRSFENVIQSNITESFKEIKLSLDANLSKIDKMFIDKFSQNSLLLNQLTLSSPTEIEEKKLVEVVPTGITSKSSSQIDTSKTSLFTKPIHVSQPLANMKPIGDAPESDNDKVVSAIKTDKVITKTQDVSVKQVDKPNSTDKTDSASQKSSLFSFAMKEPSKPLFGQINPISDQSSLFTKCSPSKEPAKPQSSIFGGLNTTVPPPSNAPLFGSLAAASKPFANFSESSKTSIFGTKPAQDKPLSNLFGAAAAAPPSGQIFGSIVPKSEPVEAPTSGIFGSNSNEPSFNFLSSATEGKPSFGSATEVNWKAGSKLFSHSTARAEQANDSVGADNENDDQQQPNGDEEHDPHFQPIIDLPPLVAISKDEESHEVLFRSRCKLYRFIGGEWKERGVGEMKVLKTKPEVDAAQPVKLLMRRDQVRKICCNQRVSKTVPSFATMPNVKSTCWVGNDFSEGAPTPEKFAVRFSHVDVLLEFQAIVSKIQESLSADDGSD